MSGDLVAAMDQAEKVAAETARPVAAFYTRLKEAGMHEDAARQMTMLYTRKLLKQKE